MSLPIQTREIEYTAADGQRLIAYFAAPETNQPIAGVIVAPEWWGRNDYTEQRARELAAHGFAALAIDMYGDKKVTTAAAQASEWMMQTFEHADTIVQRAQAGLAILAAQPEVNATKLAAIGFCYGGKVAGSLACRCKSAMHSTALQCVGACSVWAGRAVAGMLQGVGFTGPQPCRSPRHQTAHHRGSPCAWCALFSWHRPLLGL